MAIPLPLAFPPGPTWLVTDADNPVSLPVLGQFDPKIQDDKGKPIWQKKAAILGGSPWLKFIGTELGEMTFEFFALATNILDQYPLAAWNRLNELSGIDSALGRPPRVIFTYGVYIVEGFITQIPRAEFVYWGGDNLLRSRLIRQVGPVRITITKIPRSAASLPFSTNFVVNTEEIRFEDLSKTQYGDARFSQTLAIHNQGVRIDEMLELPRRDSDKISTTTPIAPYFDDPIVGVT